MMSRRALRLRHCHCNHPPNLVDLGVVHQHYPPRWRPPRNGHGSAHSLLAPPISKLLHTAPANGPWRGPLLHIAAPALPSSRRQLASSMTAVDKGWAANATSCRSFPSGGTSRRHMHRQPPQYPGSRLQWKTGGADAGCGASSRHQQHNSSFSRHLWRWRA